MLSTQRKLSIGYSALTILGVLLINTVFFAPQSENLSYRDFKTLLEAAHTRVRATLTAQRGLLEALDKVLMVQEVVDHNTLLRLLGRAGFETPSDTPGSPDGEAETGTVVEAHVTFPYNGERTSVGASRQ